MTGPSPATRRRGIALAAAVLTSAAVIVVLTGAALMVTASLPATRRAVARSLGDRLGLDVSIDALHLSFVPRPRLIGSGLRLRLPGRPDLPPLIEVEQFSASFSARAAFDARAEIVRLTGLHVSIPPDVTPPSPPPGGPESRILAAHLEASQSTLTVLRKSATQAPLVFTLEHLAIDNVGFARVMPFHVVLINALPVGLIDSNGHLGPWQRGQPAAIPVDGDYSFTNANLEPIAGIAGTLSSTGHYVGAIGAIHVTGQSLTPDFSLDLGGRPMRLACTFEAIVDATDGTTVLENVSGKLGTTPIRAKGAVTNLPGPGRHDVSIDADIDSGRIDDLLHLVDDAAVPLLTGVVSAHLTVALPPGPGKAGDRLRVAGRFSLTSGHFTNRHVEHQLSDLSQRSQGKNVDDAPESVVTNLGGAFRLADRVATLSGLTFRVPGADVALDGTYRLEDQRLDFTGTLRMQATVSKAVGGVKSVFLKPFDFLFKKRGAGAVIPFAITGTRTSADMHLRIAKMLTGG